MYETTTYQGHEDTIDSKMPEWFQIFKKAILKKYYTRAPEPENSYNAQYGGG
jgi:hypothetical protein